LEASFTYACAVKGIFLEKGVQLTNGDLIDHFIGLAGHFGSFLICSVTMDFSLATTSARNAVRVNCYGIHSSDLHSEIPTGVEHSRCIFCKAYQDAHTVRTWI